MNEFNMNLPVINSSDIVNTLLIEWDLQELISDFQQKGIDIEVFKDLTASDIDNLIPLERFGLRIKLRKKLFAWNELNGYYTPLPSTETPNSSPRSSSS